MASKWANIFIPFNLSEIQEQAAQRLYNKKGKHYTIKGLREQP